ncbi:MAG: hypothetical protein LBU73_00995 [Helicobacteraceae bacterium]|nr:hypothetical protein [Helicobacteraceae bacterium]
MNTEATDVQSLPNGGLDYYLAGVVEFEKGNLDLALSNLSKSIELESHFKTYQKMSEALERMKNDAKSFEALETAYNLNPVNDNLAYNYARKLLQKKELDKCRIILHNIISRNSTYLPAKKLLEAVDNALI